MFSLYFGRYHIVVGATFNTKIKLISCIWFLIVAFTKI